ncbi:MAG TPA: efflux RND transporter periplasmic adaptor subunit [Bryobacteraceae bacterium]|nr:efflux RND transporter periplasmic adaptor subunit [Bryobacteraceae bacterium]
MPRTNRGANTLWVVLALLTAGAGFLFSQRSGSPPSKGNPSGKQSSPRGVPVAVTAAERGNLPVFISAIGTVTPVYTVNVTSRVGGQLMEVYYKEGQIVKKGDLLALIDPRPYNAAVVQAQGQLARDQATLANSRIDLRRYQSSVAEHAIPEQTYTTAQATVAQNEGTVKVDQGNLEAAQVNLDYTRITAPIAGRVGLRGVDPGNIVQANGTTALLTIAQLQPITVIFTMAENYISDVEHEIRLGHTLRVDALDHQDQRLLATGTLLTLDNQVDTATGTVRVRASFANRNNQLFPNEFVNARLLLKTLQGVTIVPTAAIQRNGEEAFVYVVNPADQTARLRDIKIAQITGPQAAVTGVNPGESLVTDGFANLVNGSKVSIRPAGPQGPAAPGQAPQQ